MSYEICDQLIKPTLLIQPNTHTGLCGTNREQVNTWRQKRMQWKISNLSKRTLKHYTFLRYYRNQVNLSHAFQPSLCLLNHSDNYPLKQSPLSQTLDRYPFLEHSYHNNPV